MIDTKRIGFLHSETFASWSWRTLSERGLPHLWTGRLGADDAPMSEQQRARNEAAILKIRANIERAAA